MPTKTLDPAGIRVAHCCKMLLVNTGTELKWASLKCPLSFCIWSVSPCCTSDAPRRWNRSRALHFVTMTYLVYPVLNCLQWYQQCAVPTMVQGLGLNWELLVLQQSLQACARKRN